MIQSNERAVIDDLNSFTFILENKDADTKDIDESLLNDQASAQKRAIYEFLHNGLDKQEIEFETPFVDLSINSIIAVYAPRKRVPADLTKDRFIVKSTEHIFSSGFFKTRVRAVRYD